MRHLSFFFILNLYFVQTKQTQYIPPPRKCLVCSTEYEEDCQYNPPSPRNCGITERYCITIVITNKEDKVVSFTRDCSPTDKIAGCEMVAGSDRKRCISACDNDSCNSENFGISHLKQLSTFKKLMFLLIPSIILLL